MVGNFIENIDYNYSTDGKVYDSLFEQYEHVIVQSLITSFGLDFLVKDQYGGDVDTIHNVRRIGIDDKMKYKNKKNEDIYNNKDSYDSVLYHKGGNFQQKKHEAREIWKASGKNIKDEYTNKDIGFYGHTKSIPPDKKAELDHIISAKEIHEDRGRILSGLDGKSLADSEDNFAWTNKSLNASMQDKSIPEYIKSHPNLDDETKKRMFEKNKKARESYNVKINRRYYSSVGFFRDSFRAAGKVGLAMGLREAFGLVFSEIWFAVKYEIKQGKEDGKTLLRNIANGVKKGFENAKSEYRELWKKFLEGSIGGILASLTTTICNIFFTTAKNIIRIIRQSWASLVQALKIILFNPDCLPLGERFRAAAKIIATGASIVAGTFVGDLIAKTGVSAIPVVGDIVVTFCGTLITGILSCTLLYILDTNSFVNKIVKVLNSIPTIDDIVIYYKEQAQLLEEYCAKLMNIDLAEFQKEIHLYSESLSLLEKAKNQEELNNVLLTINEKLQINSPIGSYKNFEDFMNDPNSKLIFS